MDPRRCYHLNFFVWIFDWTTSTFLREERSSLFCDTLKIYRFIYDLLLFTESLGLLVLLSFAITGLTPVAYQGHRL